MPNLVILGLVMQLHRRGSKKRKQVTDKKVRNNQLFKKQVVKGNTIRKL